MLKYFILYSGFCTTLHYFEMTPVLHFRLCKVRWYIQETDWWLSVMMDWCHDFGTWDYSEMYCFLVLLYWWTFVPVVKDRKTLQTKRDNFTSCSGYASETKYDVSTCCFSWTSACKREQNTWKFQALVSVKQVSRITGGIRILFSCG